MKKYHDENKTLKERISEAEAGAGAANPNFKPKVVEGSILKDSLNKSMNYKNIMQSFVATDDLNGSQKKLYNCQSFQDLKTKVVEKENFKFKEPTKDFGYDDSSPSKMSPGFSKSTQQKKGFSVNATEKDNAVDSFHENGRNTIEVGNLVRESSKLKHNSQGIAAEISEKPSPGQVGQKYNLGLRKQEGLSSWNTKCLHKCWFWTFTH